MTPERPAVDDLEPWALHAFEQAYRRQPHEQASRDDIAYGFVPALRWAHVTSAFRDIGSTAAP
jgi:hypothetical protein